MDRDDSPVATVPLEALPPEEKRAWQEFLQLLETGDPMGARNKLRLVLGFYTRNLKEIPPEVLSKFNELSKLENANKNGNETD